MDIGRTELAAFVYTLAVLITGMWVQMPEWPIMTPSKIPLLLVTGIGWTIYFQWSVAPKLTDPPERTGEADDSDTEDGVT